jgi:hypothetical protein
MSELRVTTTEGVEAGLKDTVVESFKTSLRGTLLHPGEAGYDEARTLHNGTIDRRPALIARCAGVADVMAAVRFAREHTLLVSVRGGHGMPGYAVCDGGLMIDLACMKGVRVDPHHRSVRAEAGVTWHEFDHETQAFGLATTGGVTVEIIMALLDAWECALGCFGAIVVERTRGGGSVPTGGAAVDASNIR